MKRYLKSTPNQKESVKPSISPEFFLQDLTLSQYNLLGFMIGACLRYGYMDKAHCQLGDAVDKTKKTSERAIKKFVEAGIIQKQNRQWLTNVYTLNPTVLHNVEWYNALNKYYYWFRNRVLPLALLASCNVSTGTSFVPLQYLKNFSYKRHTTYRVSMGHRDPFHGMTEKDKSVMKQWDPVKGDKVRKIALALNRRGANLTNHEASGLLAYDISVLEKACTAMKAAQNIHNPAAFFLGLCRNFSEEAHLRPDHNYVRIVRSFGMPLTLKKEEEGLALYDPTHKPVPAPSGESPKRERRGPSYNDQVKRTMQEQRDDEKHKESLLLPVAERIRRQREFVVEMEKAMSPSPVDQYKLKVSKQWLTWLLEEEATGVPASLQHKNRGQQFFGDLTQVMEEQRRYNYSRGSSEGAISLTPSAPQFYRKTATSSPLASSGFATLDQPQPLGHTDWQKRASGEYEEELYDQGEYNSSPETEII